MMKFVDILIPSWQYSILWENIRLDNIFKEWKTKQIFPENDILNSSTKYYIEIYELSITKYEKKCYNYGFVNCIMAHRDESFFTFEKNQ